MNKKIGFELPENESKALTHVTKKTPEQRAKGTSDHNPFLKGAQKRSRKHTHITTTPKEKAPVKTRGKAKAKAKPKGTTVKANKGNKKVAVKGHWPTASGFGGKTRPKDTERSDKLVMVFFDEKTLNEMTSRCLPVAKGSEFQIHYRALAVHITKGEFEVVLSIPTAFYNFKQEVSGGAVEYDLNDIDDQADAVHDVSKINLHLNLKSLPLFQALQTIGYEVNFKEGNFGSIHRHPGRFGFSTIDLGKNPDSPGVIYRNKVATDTYQTDSVMYINEHSKTTEIYTTEARIVNIKESEDGGVDGDYCKVPTLTIMRPEERASIVDPVCAVLGDVDDDVFGKFHFTGAFGAEVRKYPLLEGMLTMLDTLEYSVCTENVKPERITQLYASRGNYYGGKGGNPYGKHYQDFGFGYGGLYDDMWDEDIYNYGNKQPLAESLVSPAIEAELDDEYTEEELIIQMMLDNGINLTKENLDELKLQLGVVDDIDDVTIEDNEQQEVFDYFNVRNPVEGSNPEEQDPFWKGW